MRLQAPETDSFQVTVTASQAGGHRSRLRDVVPEQAGDIND
jgi:hypothetical protein